MRIAVFGARNHTADFRENIEDSISSFATVTYFHSDKEFVSEARNGMIEVAYVYVQEGTKSWLDAIRILLSDEKVGLIDLSVIATKESKTLAASRKILSNYKIKDILYEPVNASDLGLVGYESRPQTQISVDGKSATKKLSEFKDTYKKGLLNVLDTVAANVVSVPANAMVDGLVLNNKDEMIEQMTRMEKLIASDPANYSHKFSMLTHYILAEDFERANRLFMEMHDELQALNESTWLIELANVCIRHKCISFASITIYTIQDSLEPKEQWHTSILKSKLQLMVGDIEKAEIFYNEALLGNPRPNSEMMNLRGLILKMDGDLPGAAKVLKECFHKSQPDHRVAYNLALVFDKINEKEEAQKYYRKCLEIHPHFQKAKDRLKPRSE